MKSKTKEERADIILTILVKNVDATKPLATWLSIINNQLSSNRSLRTTKELAHVFKYIACVVKPKKNHCFRLEKYKELRSEGRTKIATVYYTFKLGQKCNQRGGPLCLANGGC